MKVAVYLPTYNDKHCDILRSFAAGIPGAIVKKAIKFKPGEADIGVVFGWFKYAYEPAMCKKPIIDHYLSMGTRHLIVVESGFQLRGIYYQVGWNEFAGYADFNVGNVSDDRWKSFGIKPKHWRKGSDGVCTVIGQLPRDTQVQDENHIEWCQHTVAECQKIYGDVIFRPHPKIQDPGIYGIDENLIEIGKLRDALSKSRCVVTWNSTTGVDAVIAGVPVVAMDRGAMAWRMASHALNAKLRNPSRREWLNQLGYSQWTQDEMRAGLPWRHLIG